MFLRPIDTQCAAHKFGGVCPLRRDGVDALNSGTVNSLQPMPALEEVLMQLPPWGQGQEQSGRAVLSALLDYVNSREDWLKVALESMGSEQSYYATCHSVQNEYVQRLCEEVENRQATAHDDGATLHDIIKCGRSLHLSA
eukprot:COSAG02_NODE_1491_length_12358_cov_52.348014_6_plen_140_part_00